MGVNMDYSAILIQTWKTLWKHKAILGFGFLLVVVPGLFALLVSGIVAFSPSLGLERLASRINGIPLIFMAMTLVVMLLSIAISLFGFAGILKGTLSATAGAEKISFGELWAAGLPFVGRLAGLFLLIGSVSFLLAILPALLGFITAGLGFLCLLPVIFLIIPLVFLLQTAMSLGMSAVVADNLGGWAALQRTGHIFRRNFWSLALMSLIIYLLQTVLGFLVSSPISVGLGLYMLLWWRNVISSQSYFNIFGILAAIVIPLILVVHGFLVTYIQSAWMLAYLRLTRSPHAANDIKTGV
jgi:hypothetical protein